MRGLDRHVACASWPLSESALAYFPDARSVNSDRDLDAGAFTGGNAMPDENQEDSGDHGHVPVLLDRCVELLTTALTRNDSDGNGAVLLDATLGAGGHSQRFLHSFRVTADRPGSRSERPSGSPASGCPDSATASLLVRTRYDGIEGALDANRLLVSQRRLLCPRHPLRPRRVLDATRPHRARVLLRPRTRHSI